MKQQIVKRLFYLVLTLLLVLSLAACKGQAEEQESQPPTTPTITPTEAPTPEPAPAPPIPYTDIPNDAYYYDAVVWAYENGITSDSSTFEPASTCTRGQVITFIWRAMGSPALKSAYNPFDDVSSGDWFYESALWAYRNDVITGSTFNSSDPCTNAQALTFLWRAEGRPMTAAASDEYYAKAVVWADNGGMFAEMDSAFDSAAPCTRASLMTYLYWAVEQWTFSEEDKTVQAEYEQIIHDAQNYYVNFSGLVYADYMDIDGDGKIELLTIDFDSYESQDVTVAIYANIDGHAQKTCEKTFSTYDGDNFFTCRADGQLYLCQNIFSGDAGETYDYYRIENGAITFCEEASIFYRWETPESDTAILKKYTKEKDLFTISSRSGSAPDRGLLPNRDEYDAALRKDRIYYWAESDPLYAAVLNGDFSAFAGSYGDKSGLTGDIVLSKDGIITGGSGDFTSLKPANISIDDDGTIRCTVAGNRDEYYSIYPVGVNNYSGSSDSTQVRIVYTWLFSGMEVVYSKIS